MEAQFLSLFAYACIAVVVVAYLAYHITTLMRSVAYERNIVDHPVNELKNHKKPVAYLGGIAVVASWLFGVALFLPLSHAPFFSLMSVIIISFGVVLLALLGFIDDLVPLTPHKKLLGIISVVLFCFVKGGIYAKQIDMFAHCYPWISIIAQMICFCWFTAMINAINIIDVMDGLASTLALIISLGFIVAAMLTQSSLAIILGACFVGALIGFLYYNYPPASMYLGDSGALLIGGMLGSLPFLISWQSLGVVYGILAVPIMALLPLFEVFALIVIRISRGLSWYKGSRHHFCHYLLDKGFAVHAILFIASVFQLLFVVLGLLLMSGIIGIYSAVFLTAVILLLWMHIVYV